MDRRALKTSHMMYKPLPDGSPLDYNRIHDVIDEVVGTKKIAYKAVLRNPERALMVKEAHGGELPGVKWLLDISAMECLRLRTAVGRLICMLKDEKQRLVMTAH